MKGEDVKKNGLENCKRTFCLLCKSIAKGKRKSCQLYFEMERKSIYGARNF